MKTSEAIDQLATALAAAQAEMPNAVFNRENPHFHSKYADMSAIRDAIFPVLGKHGLSVVMTTNLIERFEPDGAIADPPYQFMLEGRLLHKSGQWIEADYPLTVSSPQAMGSQLTYARRYVIGALTGIAAEDDDDANAAQDEAKKQAIANPPPATLPWRESQPLYGEMIEEVRALTTKDAMIEWAAENADRRLSLHPTHQTRFRDAYGKHLKSLLEAAAATGAAIDDEIPQSGGGDEQEEDAINADEEATDDDE